MPAAAPTEIEAFVLVLGVEKDPLGVRVDVGAGLDEHGGDVSLPPLDGDVQRRLACGEAERLSARGKDPHRLVGGPQDCLGALRRVGDGWGGNDSMGLPEKSQYKWPYPQGEWTRHTQASPATRGSLE